MIKILTKPYNKKNYHFNSFWVMRFKKKNFPIVEITLFEASHRWINRMCPAVVYIWHTGWLLKYTCQSGTLNQCSKCMSHFNYGFIVLIFTPLRLLNMAKVFLTKTKYFHNVVVLQLHCVRANYSYSNCFFKIHFITHLKINKNKKE